MSSNSEQTPPQGHHALINGINLYYEIHGVGTPLLLLHGLLLSSEQWQPYRDELASHYQLIIPDMRGHGRSLDGENCFTFAQSTQDLLLLLDQLGIDQCKAIGDSAGGICLQLMASQQPDRFDAIVLIECASHITEESRAAILAELRPEIAEWDFWQKAHSHGASQVRALILRLPAILDAYNAQPPDLAKISAKSLVVAGDRDGFFPLTIALDLYRSIANASLWIIPNAGHGFLIIDSARHATSALPILLEFLQD